MVSGLTGAAYFRGAVGAGSVCESAVHAGVIQREEGGVVTVLIGPPLRRFERSTQNGVSSRYSNRRRFSFTFVR